MTRAKAGNPEGNGKPSDAQRRWLASRGNGFPASRGTRGMARRPRTWTLFSFPLPFDCSCFELFFSGALKNRKVRVRQPDPRWKVPESTHYLGKLIIVIIPRSTCHKSKFRKSRKVGREYHPQSHEAEKSLVNILVSFLFCLFFFWYLLSAEFLIT